MNSTKRETILQFGGGNFLRAFVDVFVHEANQAGGDVGQVVVVQSTASGVAERINRQNGKYHVVTRGLRDGAVIDETTEITSLSRAIDATGAWDQVVQAAMSPVLKYIVSNTTEAGFALNEADRQRPTQTPPVSFPAKLTALLWHRLEAGLTRPLMIMPCELLPANGERLRALVMEQAKLWSAPADFVDWLESECDWVNSLVDRIVSGKPEAHPLLQSDALLTVAEPYAMWAIQKPRKLKPFAHRCIELLPAVAPIELRKVRILNGAHTALVMKAIPLGIVTVREAVQHSEVGPWLKQLLLSEVVPAIADRVPDASGFVTTTLERFANPFLEHRLDSIALNHVAKVKTRLLPTLADYTARFGHTPRLLSALLENNPVSG